MMAGRIDAVNALLKQHAPDLILDNNKAAKPDLDVHFYLNCMQFIELIRCAQKTSAATPSTSCQLHAGNYCEWTAFLW